MSDGSRDARLRELTFLAKVEREGSVTFADADSRDPEHRQMIVHLLREGCLNGLDVMSVPVGYQVLNRENKYNLELEFEFELWRDIASVLSRQRTHLRISHKGRVRRSELEQALRSGRDREPFGILWDSRHLKQAIAIAVLSAAPDSPVCLAYLDMNGLKSINDGYGHHAGDAAIRTYLQTVAMFLKDKTEGFRGGSADEVVVVMRDSKVEKARETMLEVLKQLQKERVQVDGKEVAPCLTASCGIAATAESGEDPEALLKRADAAQNRAKEASRPEPRKSALGVENKKVEIVPASTRASKR